MDPWRGPAAIIDVDGTLADVSGILHHIIRRLPGNRGFKDFDAFHRESVWVPPIQATLDYVAQHRDAGRGVLIMTARRQQWEPQTRGWLATHNVGFDHLFMRPNDDDRPDHAVKADMLQKARLMGWNPTHAIDDNPSIVKLWQMEGINVTTVPGWVDE